MSILLLADAMRMIFHALSLVIISYGYPRFIPIQGVGLQRRGSIVHYPPTAVTRFIRAVRYSCTDAIPLPPPFSAKALVPTEPNVSYICSRYYRAPELIFGATLYTVLIGTLRNLVCCAPSLL